MLLILLGIGDLADGAAICRSPCRISTTRRLRASSSTPSGSRSRSTSCRCPSTGSRRRAFTSNKARAALIIPEHFGRDIARGGNSPVQMLIDASDANTAKLVAGYAGEITRACNANNGGGARVAPGAGRDPVLVQPGAISKKFYGPGIFVLGALAVPAAAGHAGHGERRRAEDHPAGLRFQHFGA